MNPGKNASDSGLGGCHTSAGFEYRKGGHREPPGLQDVI